MIHAPNGLPVLAWGAHLAPEDGACLMEYVSVLAGERFTDAPLCTDPMLATLARLVNDATSDGGRDRLGALAAALVAAPPTASADSSSLVHASVLRVHTSVGRSRRLERHLRRARRRLDRTTARKTAGIWSRWLDLAHRRGAGRRGLTAAVDATAVLPEARRDALLYELLFAELADRQSAAAPYDRALHPAG